MSTCDRVKWGWQIQGKFEKRLTTKYQPFFFAWKIFFLFFSLESLKPLSLLLQSPLFVANGHGAEMVVASIGQKIMGAGDAAHWKIPQCCALKKTDLVDWFINLNHYAMELMLNPWHFMGFPSRKSASRLRWGHNVSKLDISFTHCISLWSVELSHKTYSVYIYTYIYTYIYYRVSYQPRHFPLWVPSGGYV